MLEVGINYLRGRNRKGHFAVRSRAYGVADAGEGIVWNISDIQFTVSCLKYRRNSRFFYDFLRRLPLRLCRQPCRKNSAGVRL
jgi:hypothetical protein